MPENDTESNNLLETIRSSVAADNERKVNAYNEVYAWTDELVTQTHTEPSLEQIKSLNVDRWVIDLLKDPDYVPSKAFAINYISKVLKSEEIMNKELSGAIFANREYRFNEQTPFFETDQDTNDSQLEIEQRYKDAQEKVGSFTPYERWLVTDAENHPDFPKGLLVENFDETYGSDRLISRNLAERLSKSEQGPEVASWFLNNAGEYLTYTETDSVKNYFYMIRSMVGPYNENNKDFYQDFSYFIASMEKPNPNLPGRFDSLTPDLISKFNPEDSIDFVQAIMDQQSSTYAVYTTPTGKQVEMDSYDQWDFARVTYGFHQGRTDFVDGLVLTVSQEENAEIRNKVLGQIFGEKGPAEVLNYLKIVQIDESFSLDDRKNVENLLNSFTDGIVDRKPGQRFLPDIDTFYNTITEEYHPMTEEREGDKRVAFLQELFEAEGISQDDLVVDLACGTGWLKHRLEKAGFSTIGIDMNEKLLREAKSKYGEEGYYKARWDNLSGIKEIEDAKVILINGRSIHHAEGFPGMHGIMMELDGVDMIVFDALDPTTGGRADSLDIFRQSLVNFGFNKEWLDQYMWQGVGSIDGTILGDRWYPPEKWWRGIAAMYGYTYEKVVEHNYDGTGTDNMVQILRRVKDDNEREVLQDTAFAFFMEEMSDQPHNPNGYELKNWQKPRKKWYSTK